MAAILDLSLRRRLLHETHDLYSVQSHLDLAEVAIAAGYLDSARLLYELAFVQLGFSARATRQQIAVAQRTGLWSEETVATWPKRTVPAARHSAETAVRELRRLIDAPIAHDTSPPAEVEEIVSSGGGSGALPGSWQPEAPRDAAADCAALCRLLRSPGRPEDRDALAMLSARLERRYAGYPAFDMHAHASGPPSTLIGAFGCNSLRRLALIHHRLAFSPFGSTELLREAAQLDPGGLGAFFSNVPRLIRGPEDVFGLIHAAAGGTAADDLLERWVVILSTHLDPHTLHRIVEMLGDLRLARALRGILALAAREPDRRHDHHFLFALRDAGLDIGDMYLAGEAQRLVAVDRRDVVLEWRILGEIHATAGETVLARQAFSHGLRFDRHDEATLTRLRALDEGAFAPFAIRRGFGEHSRKRQRAALDPALDAMPVAGEDPAWNEPASAVYSGEALP